MFNRHNPPLNYYHAAGGDHAALQRPPYHNATAPMPSVPHYTHPPVGPPQSLYYGMNSQRFLAPGGVFGQPTSQLDFGTPAIHAAAAAAAGRNVWYTQQHADARTALVDTQQQQRSSGQGAHRITHHDAARVESPPSVSAAPAVEGLGMTSLELRQPDFGLQRHDSAAEETESDDEMANAVNATLKQYDDSPQQLSTGRAKPPGSQRSGAAETIKKHATKRPASKAPKGRFLVVRLTLDGEWLRQVNHVPPYPKEDDDDDDDGEEYNPVPGGKAPRSSVPPPPPLAKQQPFMPALRATLVQRRNAVARPAGNRTKLAKLGDSQHEARLLDALARYVDACGGEASLLDSWRATVEARKEGSTVGGHDVYYVDPSGRRFRSKADVARSFNLEPAVRAPAAKRATAAKRAPKVPANLGFGKTKKARRRAAHARRYAALTSRMRASLAALFDQVEKRERAKHAEKAALLAITEDSLAASRSESPALLAAVDVESSAWTATEDGAEQAGGSLSVASGGGESSRLDKLRIKLREHQLKQQAAKQRVEHAERILSSAARATETAEAEVVAARDSVDAPDRSEADEDENMVKASDDVAAAHSDAAAEALDDDSDDDAQLAEALDDDKNSVTDDKNSVTDDKNSVTSAQAAASKAPNRKRLTLEAKKRKKTADLLDKMVKKRRSAEDKASKDAERERKALGRLEKSTARLEELVAEAEAAAEKRMAVDAERRRKKAAKEAEALARRAEREADLEARRERKERDAANRKRERDDELEARRLERDAEAAATAAAKARAELDKRLQQRYPIDDLLLGNEPPRDPPLPPRPMPRDPTEVILRAVPKDAVGDVLSIHAMLRSAFSLAARDAQAQPEPRRIFQMDDTRDIADLGPDDPPPLDTFVAALMAPLGALSGRRGALRPLRTIHATLLKLILDDPSTEAWWPRNESHPDVVALLRSSSEDDDDDFFEDSRNAHPWDRFLRRFVAKHGRATLSDTDTRGRRGSLAEQISLVIAQLKKGVEADTETRKWIAVIDECGSGDEALVDALRCASRLTSMPAARTWLETAAAQATDAPAKIRQEVLNFAQRVRATRPRAWRGVAAMKDAARLRDAGAAAQTWAEHSRFLLDDDDDDDDEEAEDLVIEAMATAHGADQVDRAVVGTLFSSRASSEAANSYMDELSSEASAPRIEDGWRVNGSEYVGRRVRRSILDDDGKILSHSDGVVAGWLPATESDYLDANGLPAALWHVKLETGELAGDEEDLELDELLDSLIPVDGSVKTTPSRTHRKLTCDEVAVHKPRMNSVSADPPRKSAKRSGRSTREDVTPARRQHQQAPEMQQQQQQQQQQPTSSGRRGVKVCKVVAAPAAATNRRKSKGGNKKRQREDEEMIALSAPEGAPFPRTELVEALISDAALREAIRATRLRLGQGAGELPVESSQAQVFPRPPSVAVGTSSWAALTGAVGLRLSARESQISNGARGVTALERASRWLSEGLPYGGLSASERIALMKGLCDAYSATAHCARLVDAATDERAAMEARWEADDRERKRRAAEKERETSAAVRERLGAEAQERAAFHQQQIRAANPAVAAQLFDGAVPNSSLASEFLTKYPAHALALGKKQVAKKPRPRPGAAPPPLSAALDRLIALDAPVTFEQRNPKLPGSRCHLLYDRYKEAHSIGQVLRLGGRRGDLFNDLARGYCMLSLPEHAAIYVEAARSKTPTPESASPADANIRIDSYGNANQTRETRKFSEDLSEKTGDSGPATNAFHLVTQQPTRHRFRAEVAHERAVEACGGGDIEFVASLSALERREAATAIGAATASGVSEEAQASTAVLRASRQRALAALRRATDAGEVSALRAAVAHAKRSDVKLEGQSDIEPNKRWIIRELVDAYEALRDAEARAEEDERRRARAAERRESALPRIDPLGVDRDYDTYWTFPRRRSNEFGVLRRPSSPLRVWKSQRPSIGRFSRSRSDQLRSELTIRPSELQASFWTVFVGESEIRELAFSLDDRGIRERELRSVLLDLIPPESSDTNSIMTS